MWILFSFNKDSKLNLFRLMSFFLGIFAAYYIQSHWYHYMPYSSLCFWGYHWHHLYSGAILAMISYMFYRVYGSSSENIALLLQFLIFFGLGVVVDDITDHFLFVFDPWTVTC